MGRFARLNPVTRTTRRKQLWGEYQGMILQVLEELRQDVSIGPMEVHEVNYGQNMPIDLGYPGARIGAKTESAYIDITVDDVDEEFGLVLRIQASHDGENVKRWKIALPTEHPDRHPDVVEGELVQVLKQAAPIMTG